jgi:hypothetical protein
MRFGCPVCKGYGGWELWEGEDHIFIACLYCWENGRVNLREKIKAYFINTKPTRWFNYF